MATWCLVLATILVLSHVSADDGPLTDDEINEYYDQAPDEQEQVADEENQAVDEENQAADEENHAADEEVTEEHNQANDQKAEDNNNPVKGQEEVKIEHGNQPQVKVEKVKNCNKRCSRRVRPVCASDGKLYANKCDLRVAKCHSKKKMRAIKWKNCEFANCKSMVCEAIDKPVCGSDGKWYTNSCELLLASCGRTEGPIHTAAHRSCPTVTPAVSEQDDNPEHKSDNETQTEPAPVS